MNLLSQKKEGRTDADPRPEHVESSKTFSILGQDLTIVSKEGGTWKLKDEEELKYVPGAVVAFDLVDGEVKMGAIKVLFYIYTRLYVES
jgi:hypothetical protein